jgi:hypothetical protein
MQPESHQTFPWSSYSFIFAAGIAWYATRRSAYDELLLAVGGVFNVSGTRGCPAALYLEHVTT